MEKIVSAQNSRIKNIQKLSVKSKERKEQGLFIVEGAREFNLALSGASDFDSVFYCREIFGSPETLQSFDPAISYEVSPAVFEKIAYRENSDGVLALVKMKDHSLSSLRLPDNPLIIVLEAIEKPGNLGAILRTADAAGVDAIIVCNPLTDIYNPNVIRSGLGCIFTVPVAVAENEEALSFLKSRRIRTFAAELQTSCLYQDTDFKVPAAIVLGAEAEGLSPYWIKNADENIRIPMRGKVNSLNVSVAAAVIAFEAVRQRNQLRINN
ncbi:MAG: RNA methyltransferase [Dysgonamonadaceae bacterium]|jgi:TrmH family RNA methyltransferase|nr:RNA methyltransferase [Dysgonamonadaceae bacterium]